MLVISYVVYWLLTIDFLYSLDSCYNNFNEIGHSLPKLQSNDAVQSINIELSEDEACSSLCFRITIKYFNETYLLNPLFPRKSQTETETKLAIFSTNNHIRLTIQYVDKTIPSYCKERHTLYYKNPIIYIFVSSNKIMCLKKASISRKSNDLKKLTGLNQLCVVTCDKVDSDAYSKKENRTLTHSSKSVVSDDDKPKLEFHSEKAFSLRNFIPSKIQKTNKISQTFENKILNNEPGRSEKRRCEAFFHGKNLIFEKQQPEYIYNAVEHKKIAKSESIESETSREETENLSINKINDTHQGIRRAESHLQKSESMVDTLNEAPINNKLHEEVTPVTLGHVMSLHGMNKEKSYNLQIEENMLIKRSLPDTPHLKTVSIFNKFNGNSQTFIASDMKSDKNETTNDMQKSVQIKVAHDIRNSMQVETYHDLRKPVKVEANHDMRNPIHFENSHDMRKPVLMMPTHDLRIPVQTDTSSEFRRPVQKDITHDMRSPAHVHNKNIMQQPLMKSRTSVQQESSHNMRNPTLLHESHDLRWPVLEGETDLHNEYKKINIFQNILPKSKVNYSLSAYEKLHAMMHNLKHENINLTLHNLSIDCKINDLNVSKVSSFERLSESEKSHKGEKLKELWAEALTVCGKDYGDVTETGSKNLKGKWPWMVSLQENISGKYSHKCSASLLNNLWVVTVAHCVDMKPKSDFILVLGKQDSEHASFRENHTEMKIDEIIVHPKFNRGMLENDIALLRMNLYITFQYTISPICLPWNIEDVNRDSPDFLGWEMKYKRASDDSVKMAMPVEIKYGCEILNSTGKNEEKINHMFLCAHKNDGNCDSESGGALTVQDSEGRWSLIGLVSWGSMCTNPEQTGIYTRVSSYVQWIKDVMNCYEIFM